MNDLLFDNPILVKHLRSRLRRPQITYLLLVVLVVCGFVMWAGFAGMGFELGVPFVLFFLVQGCALHLVGTSQVASSIGQVNDSGILDFHRISPLPPTTTALGFVLGAPIREYLVAFVALPFALCSALLGKPGIMGFLTTTLVLLTTTWLFHLLAMTAGLLAPRGKTRGTNMGLGFLVVVAFFSSSWVQFGLPIPGMLTAGPALFEALADPQWMLGRANWPTFFGIAMPLWTQTLCYQLPLIVFLAIPVVRRMRSSEAALYSKGTAVMFLVVISVLNIGGIVGHKNIQAGWIIPSLLYLNATFAMLLIGAITPEQGAFLNHLRGANKLRLTRPSLWADESSNRSAVIALCGVTYAMVQSVHSLAFAAAGGQGPLDYLTPTGIALATIAYVGFAAQYLRIRMGKKGKGALFVTLFFLWIMPLMAAAVCSLSLGPDVARMVVSVSPFYGIAAGSIASLILSCLLAILYYGLLVREETRAWVKVKDAAMLKDIELAPVV